MKKSVAAAVAAALVVGTSATTFAAANPFSDVPAGHWAYKAISDLNRANIIDGYGDGTFRGDRNITRYEMAQMVAKALANFKEYQKVAGVDKSSDKNVSFALQSDLDRLKAEFRDELDALGVRVDELEKYADKVVWNGELRYRYWKTREDLPGGEKKRMSENRLEMRLLPTAYVNDHWKLKARLTARTNMREDTATDFALTYAYAEGDYNKFKVRLGRMVFYDNVGDGLIMDDYFDGAQIIYGDKFKIALQAGRWNMSRASIDLDRNGYKDAYHLLTGDTLSQDDAAANYQGVELSYGSRDDFYIGAGYHHFRSDDLGKLPGYYNGHKKSEKNANIWEVGASYNIGGDVKIAGAFAKNQKAHDFAKAYTAGLQYRGANRTPGSWGIGAAYRFVGQNAAFVPTYDVFGSSSGVNKKGVDVYANWSPFENTLAQVNYFWGKTLDTKEDTKTFFGRMSWFF